MNTSGGLLAKGHPIGATGVAQITECWWQLRGEAGDRQVETRNGYALQHNAGGRGSGVSVVNILTNRNVARDAKRICASSATPTASAASSLDRPEAKNALTIAMRDGIIDAVRDFRADPTVRAVLITGERRRVLRGHGPRARRPSRRRASPASTPRTTSEALRVGVQTFIRELWELDKPTVAAVNGAAVGPGAHLALACDFVLVHPRTRFIWSFAKWGLVADAGGAYLLPRLVGLPRAKAMVMLGEGATGAEAVDLGLAYRCVDDADALLPEAARARRAGSRPGPTRSLGLSKRLLNASFETDLATRSSSRATSRRSRPRRPTSSRAWPRSARSATRSFDGT